MKTSPNDASNFEVIQEIRKLSDRVGTISDRVEKLEIGNTEVMETVQALSEHMDERFEQVDARFANIEKVMVTKDMLRDELGKFKTTMVTKGYLDDKLADLKSDMLQTTRREIQRALG